MGTFNIGTWTTNTMDVTIKPYDAEVEYLESTGTQYINIGDAHDFRESMFVLRAMQTASYGESAILGSQEHSRFELYLASGNIRFWSGNGLWTPDTVSFPINQIGDVTLSINGSSATVTSSGQTSTASGTSSITGVEHLQIFSYRTAYTFTGRIYFVKVYVSNALTLDLIPVRFTNELGQSEGAMYDKVSGQLFRNQGTGSFLYGRDINPISARSYVNDGLVAMWDGIENAGWGIHDADVIVWKDLVGNRDLGLYSASFNNNSLYRTNASATGYMAYMGQTSPFWIVKTFEFCCDLSYSDWMIPFSVQTRDGNGYWTRPISARSSKYGGTLECMSALNWTKYPKPFSGGNLKGTLCVQWDGANGVWTIGAYFNGTALIEDSSLPSGGGNYDTNSIALGSNSIYNLTGSIYSARAYSRALTAEEIAANCAVDKIRFNLP